MAKEPKEPKAKTPSLDTVVDLLRSDKAFAAIVQNYIESNDEQAAKNPIVQSAKDNQQGK